MGCLPTYEMVGPLAPVLRFDGALRHRALALQDLFTAHVEDVDVRVSASHPTTMLFTFPSKAIRREAHDVDARRS